MLTEDTPSSANYAQVDFNDCLADYFKSVTLDKDNQLEC